MARNGRALAVSVCVLAVGAAATAPLATAGKGDGARKQARSSIIGGANVANFSNWPYAAVVLRKGQLHCGGSVIAPTKVLTAAHCVDGFNPANLTVVTGRPDLRNRAVGLDIRVAAVAPHPDYHETQIHDVGVITLAGATNAPSVKLPTPEQGPSLALPGQTLRVAGYGARSPFGFGLSKQLRETVEIVRAERRCRRAYRRIFLPQTMICALGLRIKRYGRPAIHTTACSGDSGAALVADLPTGAVAAGTVSFGGAFCGISAAPTVYSRVSDSLPFILGQL
ncbi:MAG: serine protease [Actinomycetota bacterium]|nr:serine protease [Actinomycetota bacterium]